MGAPGGGEARHGIPRISVIIPTWNRRELLKEAVEALRIQTLDPTLFEVLVMDNRSTDGTEAMLQEMARTADFRLVHHVMPENRGPARSRNRGAELARGSILAFTDSDCRPSSQWLETGMSAFDDPDVGFATGTVLYKPEQVERAGFFARESGEVRQEHPTYSTTNVFYRREIYLELGGSDASLSMPDFLGRVVDCSDTDLAWRAKEAGHGNRFMGEALVYHEREVLSPAKWVAEPYRMFVLAPLVKRHPQLRKQLLRFRVFWGVENLAFYLAVLAPVLGILVHPAFWALTLPFLVWALRLLRQNLSSFPGAVLNFPKTLVQVGFITARHTVFAVALIYGSIRFRTLVL